MGNFYQARGRIRSISARRPRAFGVCDRCGFQYTHSTLRWQMEWSGSSLRNLRILVCKECLDIPNPQLRVYVPGPDPLPIQNPRPELDRGPPMQTYPLRDNWNRIVRQNDESIIVVQGEAGNPGPPPPPTPPVPPTPPTPPVSGAITGDTGLPITDDSGKPIVA